MDRETCDQIAKLNERIESLALRLDRIIELTERRLDRSLEYIRDDIRDCTNHIIQLESNK